VAAVALSTRGPAAADRAFLWSLAGHGALLVLVLIGGFSMPRTPPPSQLAIQATVVESPTNRRPRTVTAPAPRPEARPEARPEPKPEPRPKPTVERKPEAPPPKPEPDPALAQRKAEQQKLEKEKTAAAAKREQLREKQRADQAAEKQLQEKAAAEKQKAARDKAEAERQQAAKEASAREFDRQLEEEERLLAAADSGALADYVAVIRQKVERNWVRPPGAQAGLECEVLVTQIPGGQVTAVQMGRCNADDAVRRSIEVAVLKASPLPPPDDPTLFERNLRFTFKPEQ
jgi:colicin import membrane protein